MTMRFVEPGSLRSRLVLETATPVSDGAGGHSESWSVMATVSARVEPLGPVLRFAAAQDLEEISHRVTIRHRDDVAAGMRFADGTRILAIRSVLDPDATGRYLVCMTREELQ